MNTTQNKYNGWKQPIPTDIYKNDSIDILSRMVFFDILGQCQNKDYHIVYYHGNKRIDLDLKRGQCLFVVSHYATCLKIDRRIIEKCLKVINEWYTELLIERRAYGLVITVKDYDEVVKMPIEMQIEMQIERKSNANRMQIECKSKNKSVKSVESEENEKNILDAFQEFWELYPRKIAKKVAREKYIAIVEKDLSLSGKILEGLRKQLPMFSTRETKHIPHATTWLNQARWEDEVETEGVLNAREL